VLGKCEGWHTVRKIIEFLLVQLQSPDVLSMLVESTHASALFNKVASRNIDCRSRDSLRLFFIAGTRPEDISCDYEKRLRGITQDVIDRPS
jgi:hypothetical protein